MTIEIIDNVIIDIDRYVSEILDNGFVDITIGEQTFKGIQPRYNDSFQRFIESRFTEYDTALNFIRQSPLNQAEPNYIHSDEMMGDLTVLLYLNKCTPKEDGTILYDNDDSHNPDCAASPHRLPFQPMMPVKYHRTIFGPDFPLSSRPISPDYYTFFRPSPFELPQHLTSTIATNFLYKQQSPFKC